MSASADPRLKSLDAGHAHGKQSLGRESPGVEPKARRCAGDQRYANPKTATGLTSAVAESGTDFYRLTKLDSLYACWLYAIKFRKHSLRVQRFGENVLQHLLSIQNRLRTRQYAFGPYRTFTVKEKKFRDVVDAPMKDRVVHWMLYKYLLPIWLPRFIHDSYGNLPGRGTHAAVHRLARFCRADDARWVLQLDISKYFYSVGHEILKTRILRYIGDHDIRQLLISLVDSFRTDNRYDLLFHPDSLYRRTQSKGMPIGNLSSQLFANIVLNDFDHWVKETLRVKHYIRYVDDIVVLGESPEALFKIRDQLIQRLAADGLVIHPKKIRLAPVKQGIPFLGYVVWPAHISAGRYIRRRYLQRLRQHESGTHDRTEAILSYRAMLGHTGRTN